jgi:hypothetical protein
LLSGSAVQDYKKHLPSNVTRFQSLEEVTSYIKSV